jgi:hypothetical protein
MGLLDDAIREHLELKRRHGADPSEVERQEQEALGPARRGAAPAADVEYDAGAVSVGTLDEDEDRGTRPDLYDDDDEPLDEPEPSVPAGEPEAPIAPPAPPPEPEDRADVMRDAEIVDEPPPPVERRADAPAAEDPPAEDPAAGEDVLEETPDFLQETPEHDRLWFEQKPPRDFEF